MKNFFSLARFRMEPPVNTIDGGVVIPAGIAAPVLLRRNLEKRYPYLKRRLIDPQIYLSGLNAKICEKTCINLMSYGWFGNHLEPYDSEKLTQKEWKEKAREDVIKFWRGSPPIDEQEIKTSVETCLNNQAVFGCEMIILPAPLINEARDVSSALTWLDSGLSVAKRMRLEVPLLATIAISDNCLRGFDPWSNAILDNLLDQVTSREVHGVYLAPEQASEDNYYYTHPNTIGSILRLVDGLKAGGLHHVHVAFAGVVGLLALTAGADTWSSGWYRGERRLRLADFEKREGRAYPAYYSHSLAAEIHLDSDLDNIVEAGMLSRIGDETPASTQLLRALSSKHKVTSVADWQYRQANVTGATEHFIFAMIRETKKLSTMTPDQRLQYGEAWLKMAAQLAYDVSRLGEFSDRTSLNHQHTWLQAYSKFLDSLK
jgi:hypothetical protein